MKSFIVFAAVIAVATASAVRSAGWGAPPPPPSIDLELSAAAAAAAAGQAAANQALTETVSGNAAGPASLSSASGVIAEVSQGEDIAQVAVANIPSGATSTVNAVDVGNLALGADQLDAALSGANGAAVNNQGSSSSSGEGAIAAEAASLNVVQSRK